MADHGRLLIKVGDVEDNADNVGYYGLLHVIAFLLSFNLLRAVKVKPWFPGEAMAIPGSVATWSQASAEEGGSNERSKQLLHS